MPPCPNIYMGCDCLLENLTNCVDLVVSCNGGEVWRDGPLVSSVHDILQHGLVSDKRGYWHLVRDLSHPQIRNTLRRSLRHVNSPHDRGICWIYLTLVEGWLDCYLASLASDRSLLSKWYNNYAFMRSPYHTNRFVATLSRLSNVALLPSDSLFDVAIENDGRRESVTAPSPDIPSLTIDNSVVATRSNESSSRFSSYSPSLEAVGLDLEDVNMNWVDGEAAEEEVNDNREADGASQRWIDSTPQIQGLLARENIIQDNISFGQVELETERPECDGDLAEPGWRNSLLKNAVRSTEIRNTVREMNHGDNSHPDVDRVGDGQSTGNDWNVSWNSERLGDGESQETVRVISSSSIDTTDSPAPSLTNYKWNSDSNRPFTDDLRWITDFNRLGDGLSADMPTQFSFQPSYNLKFDITKDRQNLESGITVDKGNNQSFSDNCVGTSSYSFNRNKAVNDCDIIAKHTEDILKIDTDNLTTELVDEILNREYKDDCDNNYVKNNGLTISTIMEQSITSIGDEVELSNDEGFGDGDTINSQIMSSTPKKDTAKTISESSQDSNLQPNVAVIGNTEVQLRRKPAVRRDPALRHSDPSGSGKNSGSSVRKRVSFHLDSEDKSPDSPKQKPILVRHSLNEEKLSFFSQIFPGLSGIERGSEATVCDEVQTNPPPEEPTSPRKVEQPADKSSDKTQLTLAESTKLIIGDSMESVEGEQVEGERGAPEGQEDPVAPEVIHSAVNQTHQVINNDAKSKTGSSCCAVQKQPHICTNSVAQTYHTSVRPYIASQVKNNSLVQESKLEKSQLSDSNQHLAVTPRPGSALSRINGTPVKGDPNLKLHQQSQLVRANLRKPLLSVSALAMRKIRRGILKRGPLSLYPKKPIDETSDESPNQNSDESPVKDSSDISATVSPSPSVSSSLRDAGISWQTFKSMCDSRGSPQYLNSPDYDDELPQIPLLSRLRNHLLTNSLHRVFEWSDCSGGPVLAGLTERSLCLVTPLSLSPYFTIQTLPYSDIDTVALGPGRGEVLTLITKDKRLVTLFTRGGSSEFCSRLATTSPNNNTSINYRHLSLKEFTRLHTHHSPSHHSQECENERCSEERHLYYRWVWSCRPWSLSSLAQDHMLKRSSHLMYLVNGRWIPAKLSLSASCLEIKSEVERVRYRISDLMGCDRSTDHVMTEKSVSSRFNNLLSDRTPAQTSQTSSSSTRPHTFRLRFRNKGCYTVAASDDYEVSLWMQSILLASCDASSESSDLLDRPPVDESKRQHKTLPLSLSGSNLTCSTSAACLRPRYSSVHSTLPPTVEWLSLVADETKVHTANLAQNISSSIAIDDMTCIITAPQICLIELECCEAASSDGDLLLFFPTEDSLSEFLHHLTTVRPQIAQVLEPMLDSHPLMAQSKRMLDQILAPLRNLVQAV